MLLAFFSPKAVKNNSGQYFDMNLLCRINKLSKVGFLQNLTMVLPKFYLCLFIKIVLWVTSKHPKNGG